MDLRPERGGFLRPFGAGQFIRDFLLGKGREGSTRIDPKRGATQSDINFEYKESLARATAREHSEKIISRMVLSGVDVTIEQTEAINQRELRKISRKFTHMRYHSSVMYFSVLKRLGWVEATGETEPSTLQGKYTEAPSRVYYRLTKKGMEASEKEWSNPLFALYPDIGQRHHKSQTEP